MLGCDLLISLYFHLLLSPILINNSQDVDHDECEYWEDHHVFSRLEIVLIDVFCRVNKGGVDRFLYKYLLSHVTVVTEPCIEPRDETTPNKLFCLSLPLLMLNYLFFFKTCFIHFVESTGFFCAGSIFSLPHLFIVMF